MYYKTNQQHMICILYVINIEENLKRLTYLEVFINESENSSLLIFIDENLIEKEN